MILVTGATGKVGRQAVRQLLEAGADVRALARSPATAAMPEGVEVVRGDLSDAGSLDAALLGVDAVFLVWPTLSADAAAPAVVQRIAPRRVAYLSGRGADEAAGSVLGSHGYLERLIEETGSAWTFLRAGGFAANDLRWATSLREEGVAREPYDEWQRSVIHESDIAAVGVHALTEEGHVGARYVLTGPERLTAPQRVQIISEVVGRPMRFEKLSRKAARERMLSWLPADEIDNVLRGLDEMVMEPEPITKTVEEITGSPAHTYREWVIDHRADFI